MNLLLVSYHFPPMGGSGVQRPLKLARYWAALGARVHVLTAGHEHYPLADASLMEQLPADVRVHRVRGMEPGAIAASALGGVRPSGAGWPSAMARGFQDRLYWRLERWCGYLRLPEAEALWTRAAVRAARRLIRRERIDAVVTTSPPHCLQRVGMALRRATGTPWIADLRDPILDNFALLRDGRARAHWSRLEREVVCGADGIVVTCEDLAERLGARYGGACAAKLATVTNGFDLGDAPAGVARVGRGDGKFILAHVGSFYREQSIEPLLTAVRRLHARRGDLAKRLELRIVGSVSGEQRRLIRDGDGAWLRETGYVHHAQAVREMAEADALFLMTPANEGGRYCIPAKTFEYLAFGGRIIALVHEGTSLERMLRRAGGAEVVHHGATGALEQAIERVAIAPGTAPGNGRDAAFVRQFGRDRLAEVYLELIGRFVKSVRESRAGGIVNGALTAVGGLR